MGVGSFFSYVLSVQYSLPCSSNLVPALPQSCYSSSYTSVFSLKAFPYSPSYHVSRSAKLVLPPFLEG